MYFVTTSPPHLPLGGAAAPTLPPGIAFEGWQIIADGSSAATGMRAASAMNPASVGSAAPPSYEAIVLDPNGPRSQTNLFVRKLASAVKEKDLKTMFERYGTIMSFALMRDIHTGESLGTAFVRYRTHDEARAAMAGLDGTELYGRPISIQWAKKEHDGTPCGDARRKIHKLFVRNIPLSVTARHLRQVFSQFGSINNVTLHSDTAPAVPRDAPADAQAGQMRNIAFILFQEDGAAERAVSALHNTCPFPSCEGIPLMVKLAEDNRDRLGRKQKADNMLNPSTTTSIMIANGQPTTMPSPLSNTISPAQLALDPGAAHVLGATMLPTNLGQGLSFSMAPNGAPTATAAPMLQATTDANGNTAYVYVPAPVTTAGGAAGPRMITPPAPGPYFVQTPAGLQAFSAPMQAAQVPTYYATTPTAGGTASTTVGTTVMATPTTAALQPQSQPFFPSMTVPTPVFVDAQGNPVTTMQQNMIVPNFYTPFATQQLLAQQQQQQFIIQQQMPQQQQQPLMQKRASLPSFAEAANATGQLSMMMTPNQPFIKVNSSIITKGTNERSPAAQQLVPQVPHPDILSNHSVSPQLSSPASNTNLAGSSAVATPMEDNMTLPTNTLQPAYGPPLTLVPMAAVPVGVSVSANFTGAAAAGASTNAHAMEGGGERPLFSYDSLRMNDGNSSLTAASSMMVTNDMPVSAMQLGIEEDEVSESDAEISVAARMKTAAH